MGDKDGGNARSAELSLCACKEQKSPKFQRNRRTQPTRHHDHVLVPADSSLHLRRTRGPIQIQGRLHRPSTHRSLRRPIKYVRSRNMGCSNRQDRPSCRRCARQIPSGKVYNRLTAPTDIHSKLVLPETYNQFVKTLKWRNEFNPQKAATEVHDPIYDTVGYVAGKDKKGRLVTYNLYGGLDNEAVFPSSHAD